MAAFTTEHDGWEILLMLSKRVRVTLASGGTREGEVKHQCWGVDVETTTGGRRWSRTEGINVARNGDNGLLFNDRIIAIETL